jgi:uncharacterized Zn finger protein
MCKENDHTTHAFHDWMHCDCCGFTVEVLVTDYEEGFVEIECTECGFAWVPDDLEARVPPRASAT